MPSLPRASVSVSMHRGFILAFCAECKHFVGASTEIGGIAIAARAHHCHYRVPRKHPLKIDLAQQWLMAKGAIG